jgi:hypothetical protein
MKVIIQDELKVCLQSFLWRFGNVTLFIPAAARRHMLLALSELWQVPGQGR